MADPDPRFERSEQIFTPKKSPFSAKIFGKGSKSCHFQPPILFMSTLKHFLRTLALRRRNLPRVREFVEGLAPGGPPIFILVSPADLHFAPLAVGLRSAFHRQILVGNGISDLDAAWLKERCPGVPLLRLSASLSGNSESYLPHGEIVNLIASGFGETFFIQDADCFPLDGSVFERLRLPRPVEYAAGPFWKECPDWERILPDTFLVGVRPDSLARIKRRYGVDASIVTTPSGRAAARLRDAGLGRDWRPERSHDKNYFDTLQLSWVLATLDGHGFGKIEIDLDFLHHVGGTSYLTARPGQDLSHWDWWPLNTVYTTLRILERPEWTPLQGRFGHLYETFGDAEKIEIDYPGFRASSRYARSLQVLSNLDGSSNAGPSEPPLY